MRMEQRRRQMCRAVALPLALIVAISWGALLGLGRKAPIDVGELPRLVSSTLAPQSVMPLAAPDVRPAVKPSQEALSLFVAVIVALLFGTGRRRPWSADTGMGSAATPSLLVHTVKGRAPPRLSA
jgi:hypothetical protein